MSKSKAEAKPGVYECVSPIEHDGVRIEVGSVVEMPDEVAAPLVAAGALRAPQADAQP